MGGKPVRLGREGRGAVDPGGPDSLRESAASLKSMRSV
jgi:hypothetical protein